MAEKITFELELDADGAVKGLNKVEEGVEDVGKQTEKTGGMFAKFGKTMGNVGKTISAGLGLGLFIKLFEKVTEVLSENQVIMDGINTVFTAFSIVVNDVVNVVTEVYTEMNKATGGFDASKKVIGNLMTLALTPMKLTFYGIKLGIQEAMLIWEESMFGSGDTETIDELNKSIKETQTSLKEVATDAYDAGVSIGDNIVEAVTEIGSTVKTLYEKSAEYAAEFDLQDKLSTANKIEDSKKLLAQLENSQTRIREQSDRDAERQRQIRDDETKSIAERQEANDKLFDILEAQGIAEQETISKRIAIKQREQEQLGFSQERADEIYALQTERFAVEAQQAGFLSEQLINKIGLQREEKENLLELRQIGLDDYELKLEEAEVEAERLAELAEKTIEDEQELKDALLEIETQYQESIAAINKEKEDKIVDAANKTAKVEDDLRKKKIAEDKKANQLKTQGAFEVAGALLTIATTFAKKGSKAAKALAITGVILDTIKGAMGAFSQAMSTYPTPAGPIIGALSAAAVAAMGVAQISKINSTSEAGGGVAPNIQVPNVGGEGIVSDSTSAPDFNTQGDSDINQLGNTINGANGTPIKAYVVSGEVTTQQQLDRNAIDNAEV